MNVQRVFGSFTACYASLIDEIYNHYDHVSSPRGLEVREKLGVLFEIENPLYRLPYVPQRNFSLSYMIAELVWYFSGNNSTDWIANYSSFWKKISDDGSTANSGYGARLFQEHPSVAGNQLNQYDYVVEELKKDPDSRRAVMHIRVPWDSIPQYASKDVPCTLTLQFFIRNEKLHMLTSMRSSDIILGIALDVPFFTMLQELLARDLGVGLGAYKHISASLHVYERHYEMCDRILDNRQTLRFLPPMQELPREIREGTALRDMQRAMLQLDMIQSKARSVKKHDHDGLVKTIEFMNDMLEGRPYFHDWARILVAHRARKLGFDDLNVELLSSLEFEGFGRFDR